LGGDGEWRSLDSLYAGDDGLYALDKQSGQVWHYPAGEDGTAREPTASIEGSDSSSAIGLAVNGDIYVLGEDGKIRRFSAGQEVAFDMAGLDRPLTSAASLLPLSDGSLMVVDRGNKRIVLFSGDGRFERQFVSSQLTDPQAVAVDEVTARIYVLNGDSLFVAGLPSAPGPQDANP
jgi:DNA-binding beta-propeller fold protein YncE